MILERMHGNLIKISNFNLSLLYNKHKGKHKYIKTKKNKIKLDAYRKIRKCRLEEVTISNANIKLYYAVPIILFLLKN